MSDANKSYIFKASVVVKVLVTGGAGYIGSVLCQLLMDEGFEVRVIDRLLYGGQSIAGFMNNDAFEFHKGDICNKAEVERAMVGVDHVVNLAAIVGDPNCAAHPEEAVRTNVEGVKVLFNAAENQGVSKFISASTCSNYGKMADPNALVNEDSELRPVSLYAETKVAMEEFLMGQDRDGCCKPTMLRFATAHGLSPMMRFDLTVNHFTKDLALKRELEVFGQQFWRPYCHIFDLSRAILAVLNSPSENVEFEVFNVGATSENYTKGMIVQEIQQSIPGAKVKYVDKTEDPRDYRVSFEKISRVLGFSVEKTVPKTIRQVRQAVEDGLFTDPDAAEFNIGQG